MKKRHTEEQIIAILREAEVPGTQVAAVCRKHNISLHTFRTQVTATNERKPAKAPAFLVASHIHHPRGPGVHPELDTSAR